jgi:hypothetical protein
VVEEIEAAGFEPHLAEPADTQAARGRKHRAKTDRTDARLLRDLLASESDWDRRVLLTLETRMMEHGDYRSAAEAAEVPGRAA